MAKKHKKKSHAQTASTESSSVSLLSLMPLTIEKQDEEIEKIILGKLITWYRKARLNGELTQLEDAFIKKMKQSKSNIMIPITGSNVRVINNFTTKTGVELHDRNTPVLYTTEQAFTEATQHNYAISQTMVNRLKNSPRNKEFWLDLYKGYFGE